MTLSLPDTSTDFGERFVYIPALPKSASSLMWLIVSTLQEESGRAAPEKMPSVLPSAYQPLHFDLMDMFPGGGVYTSHAPLNFDTNLFLRATLCRYIVHLRHPADYVVAQYCHGDDGGFPKFLPPDVLARLKFDEPRRWAYSISAMDADIFDRDNVSPDDAIGRMLRDGPLFRTLAWMCDWLTHRDPKRSIVSTYEGVMTDLDEAANRLCLFVRGAAIDPYRLDYLRHVVASGAEAQAKKSPKRYPKGWTGEVGAWRRYFNPDHVSLFNETARRFLDSYPGADALAAVYPDLLLARHALDDGEVEHQRL